jgi:hypothetical protein
VYSILGINKRNLAYIKKLNSQKNIRFVDNKYKTKQFLEKRWIPVPKTYVHITGRTQLLHFDFAHLDSDVFVAKPNKWSKWKGVFILKRLPSFDQHEEKKNWFFSWLLANIYNYIYKDIPHYSYGYECKWENISDLWLKKKLIPILEWNYTLANRPDTILVEEKIIPGAWFEQFCEFWLADIRVIVCNLVPVAAMLRMPTVKSWWVANLAQWGMAFGIDIVTWQIRTLATTSQIYYENFPEAYKHLYKFTIPFWDDILLHSSNVQYFVNMGYVWLDWVITANGPKLLEVNGKAWLEIQNIVWLPLQRVLDKITDLEISTPQKGVSVAKSLFTPAKDTSIPQSKVLYLSQKGTISIVHDWKMNDLDVVIVSKPNKARNYTSLEIVNAIKHADHVYMKMGSTILKDIWLYGTDRIKWHRIELGFNTLKNYYIKPVHQSHANIKFINPKNILEAEVDDLMILDRKLRDITKNFSLSRRLFPTNYLQEFDTFVSRKGNYNPIFSYNFPSFKDITLWKSQLQQLRDEHKWSRALQSKFSQLFYEKFDEIEDKINILYAYKKKDHAMIRLYNEKLFGSIDEKQLLQSQNLMHFKDPSMYQSSWKLDLHQIREIIDDFFARYRIKKYAISLESAMLGRISFVNARVPTIKLSPTFRWTRWELLGQLEHEIWVHMQRAINGQKTKWLILQRGTAHYLPDEEGLAVYKSEKMVQKHFPNFYNAIMHRKYLFVDFSEKMSFVDLVHMFYDMGYNRTLSGVFKSVVRLKRWTIDTSIANWGTTFFKDKVYLDGYKKLCSWLDKGWDIDRLMIGKIKIEDLDLIG